MRSCARRRRGGLRNRSQWLGRRRRPRRPWPPAPSGAILDRAVPRSGDRRSRHRRTRRRPGEPGIEDPGNDVRARPCRPRSLWPRRGTASGVGRIGRGAIGLAPSISRMTIAPFPAPRPGRLAPMPSRRQRAVAAIHGRDRRRGRDPARGGAAEAARTACRPVTGVVEAGGASPGVPRNEGRDRFRLSPRLAMASLDSSVEVVRSAPDLVEPHFLTVNRSPSQRECLSRGKDRLREAASRIATSRSREDIRCRRYRRPSPGAMRVEGPAPS